MAPNAATMLINVGVTVPEIMRLVTSFGYVVGMYFIIYGVKSLREIPPMGHSNPPMTVKKCLTYLAVGATLLYLPTTISVGTNTFFTETVPYAYTQESTSPFAELISVIFNIVRLIGVIAFIRGIMLFTHVQSQQEHSPFVKAVNYCIGGIFCANMPTLLMVVFNTLGLTNLN